jgi:hypothetical protein
MEYLQALQQAPGGIIQVFSLVWREAWFIFVPAILIYMMYWYWMEYMSGEFVKEIPFVLLAFDTPTENEQSPKVMEEFFNAIHSIQTNPNFLDRFWKGKVQEWFSLELVGIDGHVRFIIRTPAYFKDLVEAHLYAQFPEVEIHEVDDYTEAIPDDFKKAGLDLFGTDMVLTNKDFYPIRTYPFFEHQMTQRIIDPISTVAEVMNKLKPGEQLWMQFQIRPVMTDWAHKGRDFAHELMGKEIKAPTPKLLEFAGKVGDVATSLTGFGGEGEGSEDFPAAAFLIPPGERKVIEGVERNVSKLAFEFKSRVLYVAQKPLFDKRRFNAIMGAFKQFNSYDMNGFKPYKRTITKVDYFLKDPRVAYRQRKLLKGYKKRTWVLGPEPKILTSESLASIFHIPHLTVKAPHITRTMAKKGSAPDNLPFVDLGNIEPSV